MVVCTCPFAFLGKQSRSRCGDVKECVDEVGRRTVLDLDLDDAADGIDVIPGSDVGDENDEEKKNRRFLLDLARVAEDLHGEKDAKLNKAIKLIQGLLKEGYRPIVFCRFIPTAEYVATQLREKLPKKVEVIAVAGNLPPAEREERILQLAQTPQRVLVATDCLSEGISMLSFIMT